MGKHDDNGSYPHDCYPDRRKVADRRERDRDELGLDRERRRFEDRVAGLGAFGLPVVLSEDVPRGVAVMVSARPRRPFPEDPHGMARDDVLLREGAFERVAEALVEQAATVHERHACPKCLQPIGERCVRAGSWRPLKHSHAERRRLEVPDR